MTFHKVLIDTNICLDAAQKRKPFHTNALTIIEHAQIEDFTGLIAAHSFDTIFYILKRNNDKETVYTILDGFRRAFKVAPVTQSTIDVALKLKWNDFEDAIHYQTAVSVGCDCIVTRNKKDFRKAELPVFSPQAFLDEFHS